MKNNPIISIVTPSFNQGQFVEETIQTVLFQKGNFYIDYIIMDGGSKDKSVSIIKKYEKLLNKNCKIVRKFGLKWHVRKKKNFKYNKCLSVSYRWVSKTDKGQVNALKKGFNMAKGDIFCWLNSDDIYLTQTVFQKVINYLKKDNGLKILTADGLFIDRKGKKIGVHHVKRVNFRELLFLDYHILQPSTFFKKDIYKKSYLQEKYSVAFDGDFFIHIIYDGNKYLKTNDLLSAFRLYQENKTLGLAKRGYYEQMAFAWNYSKDILRFSVSAIYKLFQKILLPKYLKYKFFMRIYNTVRRISYKLITNEKYEERY
jgi:glycosyltransferase involved in cell wall biosynthesis